MNRQNSTYTVSYCTVTYPCLPNQTSLEHHNHNSTEFGVYKASAVPSAQVVEPYNKTTFFFRATHHAAPPLPFNPFPYWHSVRPKRVRHRLRATGQPTLSRRHYLSPLARLHGCEPILAPERGELCQHTSDHRHPQ